MIDQGTIQRIYETADIVEVVGDFVSLKKAGQNFKGLSPFTNEKTPSFFVSPAKQIFKCFSSGKGGNAVTFLMEHERLTYPEALKYLAKKYNIEIVEKEETEEEKQQKSERDSLLAVTSYAQKFFKQQLHDTEEGQAVGLSYLKERGFRDDIIEKFNLGYSPDTRDAFTKEAKKNGYKLDFLVKTGLTIKKDNYTFDRFHSRIIFPIHSLSGQVLGFGGRILRKEEKTAKYLNSPESDIYQKSQILYGLYYAKNAIVKQDKCLLVEGYTDVVSLHQAGVENVVASSGTALTNDQIRLIKRFTKQVTVLYDGDEAGIKASLRGIDLILEEGMNVKIVLFPEGEDPDSFAKSKSASELKEFLSNQETDFITFKTRLLIQEAEKDPIKKANLISDIVHSIAVIPDGITRTVYIRECSKLMDVEEGILYVEINKIRRQKSYDRQKRSAYDYQPKPEPSVTKQPKKITDNRAHERDLLRHLLLYGKFRLSTEKDENGEIIDITVAEHIISELESDDLEFTHPVYKIIYEEYKNNFQQNLEVTDQQFINHINPEVCSIAVEMFTSTFDISKIWSKNENFIETEDMQLKVKVPKLIYEFKKKKIQNLFAETEKELKKVTENTKEEEILLLMERHKILKEIEVKMSKQSGNTITNV